MDAELRAINVALMTCTVLMLAFGIAGIALVSLSAGDAPDVNPLPASGCVLPTHVASAALCCDVGAAWSPEQCTDHGGEWTSKTCTQMGYTSPTEEAATSAPKGAACFTK